VLETYGIGSHARKMPEQKQEKSNQTKPGSKPNPRGKTYSQTMTGVSETRHPFGKVWRIQRTDPSTR
jgi:hypothetical protein